MFAVMIALALTAPEVTESERIRLVEKQGEYYFEEYDPVEKDDDCVTVEFLPPKVEAKW